MTPPVAPPRLLPGRSRYSWYIVTLRSFVIGWITSGVVVVSVLVLPSPVLAVIVPIGIVIGISCGVMATLASLAAIRMAH